ncbi:MAG: primosomal protein N' [Bacteroidaceae bacterium]|nr:primosomal protein N' [Bacteroidaceae bacterium]
MFVDCIVPLPLEGVFTYNVPAHLSQKVQVGCRVNVPFGQKKQYAALVTRVHEEQPSYQTKDILAILDEEKMLLPNQLKLWQWVAEYYMCTLGEVYKAAIPSGLKDKDGVVRYKPRTVDCVRLCGEYFNAFRLNSALAAMKAAPKQQLLMIRYIELIGVNAALTVDNPSILKEITREELLKATGCSSSILKAVCERGLLEEYEKTVDRIPTASIPAALILQPLSDAQQTAMDQIKDVWREKDVCLLHGVTSSGKTEIYIHLISEMLAQGKQVLYMLPEIVLTSQLTDRLRKVFGDRLGVYHSRYTDAERVEVYRKQISDSPYDIIVGVRSSVLLPFHNLGMVIIDEEHETSFKQTEPAPRYHARNVALVMARMAGAKTLLGTATPSLESYSNAVAGKYGYVSLTTRFGNVCMPEIEVVDIAELKRKKLMNGPFSPLLLREIRQALERKEQVILFQNRRGFAPVVECHVCGWTPQCPHCDVSLTYHKRTNQLTCHYCGFSTSIAQRCPQCDADSLNSKGYGTERIEDVLASVFPEARVARMDLDTTRSRSAYEGIIKGFQHGETDILIGTQMVTKGLDFRRVSVVGILNASTMLNQPDFRSYERAYQMMTQVAGRAGRSSEADGHNVRPGRVILQVHDAKQPTVMQVVKGDYEGMFRTQMEERRLFVYPPLCRLVYVYIKHKDESVLEHLAEEMANLLRQVFGHRVLGPDMPPIARVQTMYIRKVCLKLELSANMTEARRRLHEIQRYITSKPEYKSAVMYYDVD